MWGLSYHSLSDLLSTEIINFLVKLTKSVYLVNVWVWMTNVCLVSWRILLSEKLQLLCKVIYCPVITKSEKPLLSNCRDWIFSLRPFFSCLFLEWDILDQNVWTAELPQQPLDKENKTLYKSQHNNEIQLELIGNFLKEAAIQVRTDLSLEISFILTYICTSSILVQSFSRTGLQTPPDVF